MQAVFQSRHNPQVATATPKQVFVLRSTRIEQSPIRGNHVNAGCEKQTLASSNKPHDPDRGGLLPNGRNADAIDSSTSAAPSTTTPSAGAGPVPDKNYALTRNSESGTV